MSPLMSLPQSWNLYITYSPPTPDSLEGISLPPPPREKGNSLFYNCELGVNLKKKKKS